MLLRPLNGQYVPCVLLFPANCSASPFSRWHSVRLLGMPVFNTLPNLPKKPTNLHVPKGCLVLIFWEMLDFLFLITNHVPSPFSRTLCLKLSISFIKVNKLIKTKQFFQIDLFLFLFFFFSTCINNSEIYYKGIHFR